MPMPRTRHQTRSRFWGTLFGLGLALVLAVGCSESKPLEVSGTPPTTDGAKALALAAKQVEFGPRFSGSQANKKTAEWIAETARSYGYTEVTIDRWTEKTANGDLALQNVIVKVPGHGKQFIVVGSHFDTKRMDDVRGFVGANDAASSTAALLELLRAIQAHGEWEGLPMIFAFFDGEEAVDSYGEHDGLHGSKRLAAQLAEQGEISDCRAMVLLDMIGDADLSVTIPPNTDKALRNRVLEIAKKQGHGEEFGHYAFGGILDDHVPFRERKVPTVNLIDFSYGPGNSYWHTDQDTLDKLSAESLQTVGDVTAELLWTLR